MTTRPKQWTIGGEFAKTLDFDGAPVLLLVEGATFNADHLPALVASMNAAGVVFKHPPGVGNTPPKKKAKTPPSMDPGTRVATLGAPTLDELSRSCLGKRKMGQSAAEAVAERHGQRAYACVLCHGWHCTHILTDVEVHG
jgi:hypothetical protein